MNSERKQTKCVSCFKDIKYEDHFGDLDETCLVYDGTAFVLTGGFGSNYDLDILVGVLCDECIDKANENKAITIIPGGFSDVNPIKNS